MNTLALFARLVRDGGFTLDDDRNDATTGFAVGNGKASLKIHPTIQVVPMLDAFLTSVRGPVGGWIDSETDYIYLDSLSIIADRDEAIARARAAGEIAIFDLDAMEEVRV